VRLASIDLGTNTVRLLVAEVTAGTAAWRTVHAEQRVTRLGEGLRATGTLGDAAAARTAAAVVAYVARARAAGAARVAVVATSAVREAANGRAFVTDLERAVGIAVRVISGEEEARLTLAGIVAGLGPLPGVVIAFDIGGGSTEYILARDGVLTAVASLRLGVVPLAERFPFPGPVEPARAAALRADVEAPLARGSPRWPRSTSDSWTTIPLACRATCSRARPSSGSTGGWRRWTSRGARRCRAWNRGGRTSSCPASRSSTPRSIGWAASG
jgi:exopolyphosphatase/guanosine-5'-triphosphate,3'-diphosphate pyrophosphatase